MSSRNKAIIYKILELILLLTPMVILFIMRFDKWFIKQEQVNVVNISFGAIMSGIVVFFLLKGYAKKINGIVWCGTLFLTTYLLKTIISDAYMILGASLMGLVMSYPVKLLYLRNKSIAKIVKEEYIKTYARHKAKEELSKEV